MCGMVAEFLRFVRFLWAVVKSWLGLAGLVITVLSIPGVLPIGLPFLGWLSISLGAFLLVVVFRSYGQYRNKYENWIDSYRRDHRTYPALPRELESLFENCESGKPISKGLKPVRLQVYHWARLSPTLRKQWRETVTWLGGKPDDILWDMEQTAPPAGRNRGLQYRRK